MSIIGASIAKHFAALEDPRAEHPVDHKLVDIIIAMCRVICGAETWTDIELSWQERRSWPQLFLDTHQGVLSIDTFGRVFARLVGGWRQVP